MNAISHALFARHQETRSALNVLKDTTFTTINASLLHCHSLNQIHSQRVRNLRHRNHSQKVVNSPNQSHSHRVRDFRNRIFSQHQAVSPNRSHSLEVKNSQNQPDSPRVNLLHTRLNSHFHHLFRKVHFSAILIIFHQVRNTPNQKHSQGQFHSPKVLISQSLLSSVSLIYSPTVTLSLNQTTSIQLLSLRVRIRLPDQPNSPKVENSASQRASQNPSLFQ